MVRKIILFLFVCLFTCLKACAESFYIKNYDVNMTVNRAKQVHVTETIYADFQYLSHGIIRTIPLKDSEIKNISVSEKFSVSRESNKIYIKIGSSDKYVKGEHTYQISYDFNIFDDKNEFYFNIIGTDWSTDINHVSFKVEMPKKFDAKKAGLSIGRYGTKGFEGGAKYRVVDKTVEGEVTRNLQYREGVTLRIEVPQGYFDQMRNTKQDVSLIIVLVSTLVCLLIWFLYGKDAPVIPVVNFYPPKDMSVLDIELAFNEHASKKGIVGTIINLADRGYLEIINKKDEVLFKKLKAYDGNNQDEEKIFKAIFSSGKDTVSDKGMYKTRFGNKMESLLDSKNGQTDKIYEDSSVNSVQRKIMAVFISAIALVMSYAYASFDFMQFIKGLIATGVFALAVWFLYECAVTTKHKNIYAVLVYLFVLLPAFGISLIFFEVMSYVYPTCLACGVGGVISFICFYHLHKRNKEYTRLQGELEGLKRFIKTAEIDKLKTLVEENPKYFYNVLPFAYIFNLSDKWINQFEKLTELNVVWNDGYRFNSTTFDSFIKRMDSASEAYYTSSDVGSSGSGGYSHSSSGGGGFSGGGFGGGGGHSW